MKSGRAKVSTMAAVASLLCVAVAPARAVAQSELDAAQAQDVMGHWLVTFESDQGSLLVELDFKDEGGKLAAEVTTTVTGTQNVTDITREEDKLELKWEADAQGQILPIRLEVTPQGDELAVLLDIMDGEVQTEGVGART